MRKIDKFITRLPRDIRLRVVEVLRRIEVRDLSDLDIKKLKGASGWYRARVGEVRILFTMNDSGTEIRSAQYRGDTTYH